jgi:alpha-L-rhamnosidase
LRTGFLGTPLLAPVLQDAGRSDLAYELLFRESYPSWFHSINHGATTTWERWDSYSLETGFNPQGMNSLNHYAYGSISRWFYEGILGITPAEPGFRRIHIEPQIGRELSWAKGGYQTPEGEVHVAWKVSSGHLEMSVVVPKNTVADVLLSSAQVDGLRIDGSAQETGSVVRLGPGHHDVTARMKQVSEIQQEK